jgi:hypothetical protein
MLPPTLRPGVEFFAVKFRQDGFHRLRISIEWFLPWPELDRAAW